MFAALGRLVTRYWAMVAVAWAVGLIVLLAAAPSIRSVQTDDDNLLLPADTPSRLANDALKNDFGTAGSQAVAAVIVERPTGLTGLPNFPTDSADYTDNKNSIQSVKSAESAEKPGPSDWAWIGRLAEAIREHNGKLPEGRRWDILSPADPNLFANLVSKPEVPTDSADYTDKQNSIQSVESAKSAGRLVRQAAVIKVALPHNFVSIDSVRAVDWLKKLIADEPPPPGLAVAVSGSAGYGHDYAAAAKTSLKYTTWVTVLAVIVILLVTYRALLAAGLTLATVTVAVVGSVSILAIGGQHGWSVSTIVQLFTIVIGFGAGVDFSLFFLSRYHEELGRRCWSLCLRPKGLAQCPLPNAECPLDRAECRQAVIAALAGTGPAILASAGTVAAGLALMYFARFKVFSTAGPAVSVSVIVACLASLTLVPALAFPIGRRTFWPRRIESPQITQITQILDNANLRNLRNLRGNPGFWDRLADWTVRQPITILLVGLAVLIPLAVFGWRGEVVYDTLSDLPAGSESVRGAAMFRRHFPLGEMSPVKVVVRVDAPLGPAEWLDVAAAVDAAVLRIPTDSSDSNSTKSAKSAESAGKFLAVQGVRSVCHPLGTRPDEPAQITFSRKNFDGTNPWIPPTLRQLLRNQFEQKVRPRYLGVGGQAAMWEIALDQPAYSNQAMNAIGPLGETIRRAVDSALIARAVAPNSTVPAAAALHPAVLITGDTAQMRDLRTVTHRDFLIVGLLVVVAIVVIVTLVVGDWLVAIFVMLATVLTYGSALALVGWIFAALFGVAGMDWKVNFFLFVILVAVGQDYNLFMLTRIREERQRGEDTETRGHGDTGTKGEQAPSLVPPSPRPRVPVSSLGSAVRSAIARTGAIISSCGLIMAATLGSLAASPLRLMRELGVAFIIGLLIDTFLVRPLMVPAFVLVMRRMKAINKVRARS